MYQRYIRIWLRVWMNLHPPCCRWTCSCLERSVSERDLIMWINTIEFANPAFFCMVCWTWKSWTQSHMNLPMADPKWGMRCVESLFSSLFLLCTNFCWKLLLHRHQIWLIKRILSSRWRFFIFSESTALRQSSARHFSSLQHYKVLKGSIK